MAGEVCQHTVTTKDGRKLVCGQVHDPKKCTGHTSIRDGDREAWDGGDTRPLVGIRPCKVPPMKGLKVCRMHGGHAPQTKARADERQTEEKVRKTLGRLQVVPVENPLLELQKLAGEAVAWKEKVADHVAELEKLRYATDGGEQIRGEIVLFERALDRCATVLGAIARLNIDERLAKVEERQVELVAKALSAAFAEMGMPQEQQREAIRRVGSHLRLAAG